METKDTLSLCLDLEKQEMQQMQKQAKSMKQTLHKQEIQNRLKRLNNRKLQIQECNVQEVKAADASSGDTDTSGFVSDKENANSSKNNCSKTGNDQSSEKQSSTSGKESSRSKNEYSERSNYGDDTDIKPSNDIEPIDEVPYTAEYNVFVVETQHTKQPENINDTSLMEDERVVLANLIANLKLDHDENKKIQKQLKKANALHTHELSEYKYALEESNDIRDRCRSVLYDQEIKLEKYKKYKNCQLEKEEVKRKLKETLGLLAQQKLQSDEALKTQAYETFKFKEKNAELVHQSSLEHKRYDLLRKEKEQLKKDFKISQDKDIEKLIALEN
ncbi:hypothetical protein Tco_0525116 [Tanacetum coccineum]